MKDKYPKYYKDVSELTEIDVYQTHELFQIQDCSGCIQHASKKLLLSGVRTGGKSKADDIKEARDTLTRWLQINDIEANEARYKIHLEPEFSMTQVDDSKKLSDVKIP